MDSQSLRSKASQETFISLLQLEPRPIDLDTDKDLPPLPEESMEASASSAKTSSTTASIGLSGGRGPIYYLARVQKYSSIAFNLFTAIHLANVSLIPLLSRSVPASETYLIQAREIYQTPLTEPLLVALPVLTHVASGVALRFLRRRQNLQRYGGATPGVQPLSSASQRRQTGRAWPPLSWISASGYAFAVLLWAHVGMNRVLPLKVDGDSANIGLGYVAHGFTRHPLVAAIAYGGLIAFGSGHMVWGWFRWLGRAPGTAVIKTNGVVVETESSRRRGRMWWTIHGVVLAFATLWAVGGLGVVARGGLAVGWVGKLYDSLYAKVGL